MMQFWWSKAIIQAQKRMIFEDGRINPNGRLYVSQAYKKAQVLIFDDNPNPGGANPDASY